MEPWSSFSSLHDKVKCKIQTVFGLNFFQHLGRNSILLAIQGLFVDNHGFNAAGSKLNLIRC
ncbi:hypothetical protein FM107_12540 [Sphingobacterium sp. JB170]|nr:hypothetical protein FM107_12540 [Sphingobacterium sp. JB170]